jgi:hypothetical protein
MPRPLAFRAALMSALVLSPAAFAQEEPEAAACRASATATLRETTPDVKDVILDLDSLTIAKADTKIQDIAIRAFVVGDAYLKTDKSDKPRTMICLIGDNGKALLTFFTQR